jgi:ankyrin repeat protein/DNA-binding transcriptional MerR regulator
MKPEQFNPNETPYPRLGELVHFLIHAFGLFGRGDDLRKSVRRFAREKGFNLAGANELIDKALFEPLRQLDSSFAANLQDWFTELLDNYKTIILTVPTDIATRALILKILAYELFVPSTTVFLKAFQKAKSPNLNRWFDITNTTTAVKEVLSWWLQTYEVSEKTLIKSLYHYYNEDEDATHRRLQRWKKGETLPELSSLLKLKPVKPEGIPPDGLNRLVIWLLLARAWQYILKAVTEQFGQQENAQFVEMAHVFYQQRDDFCPHPDSVKSHLLHKLGNLDNMDKLHQKLQNRWKRILKICCEDKKAVGDEIRAQTALKRFEADELSPYFHYFSEHRWGRYYAMHCDYEQALEHYQNAFEHGAYRAGSNLQDILRELLALAAFLGKKHIINHHYRWACLMGFFSEDSHGPQLWELSELKMAFFKLFPLQGLYQSVDNQKKAKMMHKLVQTIQQAAFCSKEWEKYSVDLQHLNREIKKGPRSRTQLMVFITLGQNDNVKCLLEHGADPKVQASDGSTALILALQNNNKEATDLLLQCDLGDSINARTKKYRFTALQVAIDQADFAMVHRLIKKGADIEQPCFLDEITPLYYTLNQINIGKLTPSEQFTTFVNSISADHLRRSAPEISILLNGAVFDNDFAMTLLDMLLQKQPDPKQFDEAAALAKKCFHSSLDFYSLLKIVDLLLEAGADVNKRHNNNFTPFLYSAAVGKIEVFRRLYRAGGNITDRTDFDGTILTIALRQHHFELVAYMLKRCDKARLRSIVDVQDKFEGNTNTAIHLALITLLEANRLSRENQKTMTLKHWQQHLWERLSHFEHWRQHVWEKLLNLGPNLTLKNEMGLTAEQLANRLSLYSLALELHKRRKAN